MQKTLMIFMLLLALVSCGGDDGNASAKSPRKDRVEVLYLHGKQRCATCKAIEKNTKEALNTLFADEMKDGTVVFKIVNIATDEGEKIADQYEVTWSSIFVNRWKDGKETRNDMTKFAFANARKNPDAFKKGLADKIRQSLK